LFAPHIYIVVLRAHPIRGESHNQRNANGEIATKTCRKNSIVYSSFNLCPQSAAYSTFVHKKPNPTQIKQELKYLRAVYVTLGPYFLYQKLLI